MISTILVPHDGTRMPDKAFGKAVELAKAPRSRLILLHVLEEISVPSPMLILGNESSDEYGKKEPEEATRERMG